MEIDIRQLSNIIRVVTKEAISEYVRMNHPEKDEITERQAVEKNFSRSWLEYQCRIGNLTWRRSGTSKNSPKLYSLKRLNELKDGVDPLLKSVM